MRGTPNSEGYVPKSRLAKMKPDLGGIGRVGMRGSIVGFLLLSVAGLATAESGNVFFYLGGQSTDYGDWSLTDGSPNVYSASVSVAGSQLPLGCTSTTDYRELLLRIRYNNYGTNANWYEVPAVQTDVYYDNEVCGYRTISRNGGQCPIATGTWTNSLTWQAFYQYEDVFYGSDGDDDYKDPPMTISAEASCATSASLLDLGLLN